MLNEINLLEKELNNFATATLTFGLAIPITL
jgi:hypothetical protein